VLATLIVLAALAFFPRSLSAESLIKEADRKRAPDFELPDADGKIARLSDYQAKVVLVDFWATWCVPCKAEIPWFNEFEEKYKDLGFAVLGISRDEDGWTKVKPFIERLRMSYRVLLGDAKTAYKYGNVEGLPVAFLVDRERRVAAIHFGLVSKKKVEEEIRKLLETPAESK
jgi:peroxiredoxin